MSSKKRKPQLELTFRAYTPEDMPKLRKLNDILFPIKYDDDFYKGLTLPHVYTLLAFTPNGEIVAAASARKKKVRFDLSMLYYWWYSIDYAWHGYLMTFGVAPEYRRQGLGKILLERFIEVLSQHGIKDVSLHVKRGNEDAVRFYQHNGFRHIKLLRDFYSIDGKLHDAFWMKRTQIDTPLSEAVDDPIIASSAPDRESNATLIFLTIFGIGCLIFIAYYISRIS